MLFKWRRYSNQIKEDELQSTMVSAPGSNSGGPKTEYKIWGQPIWVKFFVALLFSPKQVYLRQD
jgi:hypothetical protein